MAEDIKMNAFPVATDVAHVYIERVDGSQGKIETAKFRENNGIFRFYGNIKADSSMELPFQSGLIIVQNASAVHEKACAIIDSSGSGSILVAQSYINFFSEVSNRINILNTGENANYIVKNTFSSDRTISIIFIG